MNYSDLVQLYFERSNAMQWYWTIYILVIAAVLGFSTFRQRPEAVTVLFVTVLYGCFAYKNVGAIEATAMEQQAIRSAIQDAPPATGSNAGELMRVRDALRPAMPEYDAVGARYFHGACDLLVIVALWTKEWLRRKKLLLGAEAA